jgi:hypothetical protein
MATLVPLARSSSIRAGHDRGKQDGGHMQIKHGCPLPFALVFILGCGDLTLTDEPLELVSQEYAYRHGPPSVGPPYDYFLTAYGGPSDPSAYYGMPACGGERVDGSWYYSTGAYTFGCGRRLELRAGNRCVVVKVVDNGPTAWVENSARTYCGKTGYIIDASPLVSDYLYGTGSAGWTDCLAIRVTPVSSSTPTGPRPCGSGSGAGTFIGDPCSKNSDCPHHLCFYGFSGYPNGMCTKSCNILCPDVAGKPATFCINSNGAGRCVSRCDWRRYPGTGCRAGYHCVKMPHNWQPWFKRNVCLPPGKYDAIGETPDAEGDLPNPEELPEASEGGGCSVGAAAAAHGALPVLTLLLIFLSCLVVRRRT